MDDRDRAAPVALARDAPVAQAVLNGARSAAQFLKTFDDAALGILDAQSIEKRRVDRHAVAGEGLGLDTKARRIGALGQDHGDHAQAIAVGEVEVALVVRRAAEDGAGAIVHEHEVGDVKGQLQAVDQGVAHFEAGVVPLLLGRRDDLLAGAQAIASGDELGRRGILGGDLGGHRVMGRERAEGGAEERIGPRGEDPQTRVAADDREIDLRALGPPDPVALHQADLLRPAWQVAEAVQQVLAIGGDAEKPLRQLAPLHRRAGAPAAPVDHLLVRQDRPVDRIPVDPRFFAIGQALFQEVEEHRLFVPVVVRVTGCDLAIPVKGQPHRLELAAHDGNVLVGPFGRMDLLFHRRVLGRQAEGVPAHGMKNAEATRALITGDHVAHGIVTHVPHMNAAGGIGKHLQNVVFGLVRAFVDGKTARIAPRGLPRGFGFIDVVTLAHGVRPEDMNRPVFPSYKARPGRRVIAGASRPGGKPERRFSASPAAGFIAGRRCVAGAPGSRSRFPNRSVSGCRPPHPPIRPRLMRSWRKTDARRPSARRSRPRMKRLILKRSFCDCGGEYQSVMITPPKGSAEAKGIKDMVSSDARHR